MDWNLDKNKPICPQLCERICLEIGRGVIKPQDKLPSVREVAVDAGVNPNTVQKAFSQLESEGLIYSVRSLGWFVGDDIGIAQVIVNNLAQEKTASYLTEMENLGFSKEKILDYIKELRK